jgi:Gpi18-like mannosyltransferase
MTDDVADWARLLGLSWAVLSPFWLLTVAALAWGRTSLAQAEIKRALAWTIALSVLAAFPIAWAVYAYCAGFNPSPKISQAQTGARFAAGLLPLYSIFVAGVVFGLTDQSAVERGAPRRPLGVRILANLVLAIAGFLAFAVVGSACFFAAGPKAMG